MKEDDEPLGLLHGIKEIARYLYGEATPETVRRTYYDAEHKRLKGVTKKGGRYTGSRRLLRRQFEGEPTE
jgi:hypothetical protein